MNWKHLWLAATLAASAHGQRPVEWVDKPLLYVSNSDYTLGYDAARECLVLRVQAAGETWELLDHGWERRPGIDYLGGSLLSTMSYDSASRRLLQVDLGGTWAWDGESWTQVATVQGIGARHFHAQAFDSVRRRTVVFGGFHFLMPTAETWEFDGASWALRTPATSPPGLQAPAMAYDEARARVVLYGGQDATLNYRSDTWEYDGVTWTQSFPPNSPPAGLHGNMAYDARRGVAVLPTSSAVWEWDGVDWTSIPATHPFVTPPRIVYDESRGECVCFGDATTNGFEPIHETLSWNGARWATIDTSSPKVGDSSSLATDEGRGVVVAFGGLLGGFFGSSPMDTTWEWNGLRWAARSPATRPRARSGAALFYDAVGQRTMMFGGDNLNDLWSWDGGDWSPVPQTNPPSPRSGFRVVWDAARQQALYFGGWSQVGGYPPTWTFHDETWEWNGVSWTQRAPATVPPARYDHAVAYDPILGRVVMFGGRGGNGLLDDTWEWDGNDWNQKFPATRPAAREHAAMAFDPTRGRVVMYSGSGSSSGANDDLWEWNGNDWFRIPVAHTLPPNDWASMAYDPKTRTLLVPTATPRLIGDLTLGSSIQAGAGCVGSSLVPKLRSTAPFLGNTGFRFEILEEAARTPGVLAFSTTPSRSSVLGCTLYLGPLLTSVPFVTNRLGTGLVVAPLPLLPQLRGAEIYAQGLVVDAGAPRGFSLTNLLWIRAGDGE